VYAELNASSSNVFTMQRGALVSLAVAGVPNAATYQGRVSAVLGQVEPGSTNFTVEVIAANPGDRLQSGMAVTGTINLPEISGTGIPTAAFLDDSHTTIMIVDENGDAKQQSVKELGSDGKTSIVTGIANGTKLVSNGQLGVAAGQQVVNNDPSQSPGASPSPGESPSPGASPAPGASPHHRRRPQQQQTQQP
jgi:hypothetical protein